MAAFSTRCWPGNRHSPGRRPVGDEEERQALLLGEPDTFFTAPGYENAPLVMLRLAEVGLERLTELVTDAWRMRAPEELLGDLPSDGDSPRTDPG